MRTQGCACMLLVALFLAGSAGYAQETTGAEKIAARPTVQFTEIVRARTADEIDEQIEVVRKVIDRAEARKKQAMETLSKAELRIETKAREIDLLETNIDAAGAEKREADVASLEAQKRIAEKVKEMLKKEKALADSEGDAADAEQSYGTAAKRALDLEADLTKQRLEVKELAAEAGIVAKALARDLEGRVLQARIEAATKKEALDAAETDVLEQLEALLEAQDELGAGK